MKEITVLPTGEVTIKVGDKKIVPEQIGLPGNILQVAMTEKEYLCMLAECSVCIGKEVPEGTEGAQQLTQGGNIVLTKQALQCDVLMRLTAIGQVCTK